MVVMELRKQNLNRGEDCELYFMRTSHGVEVDFVTERGGKLDLTEVKAGSTFHDEMADNLRSLKSLLPDEIGECREIYSGRATMGSDGIEFVPFAS